MRNQSSRHLPYVQLQLASAQPNPNVWSADDLANLDRRARVPHHINAYLRRARILVARTQRIGRALTPPAQYERRRSNRNKEPAEAQHVAEVAVRLTIDTG
ncbi:hypothetical protein ABIA39_007773 [Nocardia sp. GAS34]|uniref:hypothetical protein n=1 Tax=unclassified Nocardia TaxID=2637762 RepID=UPI003D199385